jgi:hypothetical protein
MDAMPRWRSILSHSSPYVRLRPVLGYTHPIQSRRRLVPCQPRPPSFPDKTTRRDQWGCRPHHPIPDHTPAAAHAAAPHGTLASLPCGAAHMRSRRSGVWVPPRPSTVAMPGRESAGAPPHVGEVSPARRRWAPLSYRCTVVEALCYPLIRVCREVGNALRRQTRERSVAGRSVIMPWFSSVVNVGPLTSRAQGGERAEG